MRDSTGWDGAAFDSWLTRSPAEDECSLCVDEADGLVECQGCAGVGMVASWRVYPQLCEECEGSGRMPCPDCKARENGDKAYFTERD